jgi:hypothetical protein
MDEYLKIKKLYCNEHNRNWKANKVIDKEDIIDAYRHMMELLDEIPSVEFVKTEYQKMFQKMAEIAELEDGGHDIGMDDFQVRRVVDGEKWWSDGTESSEFVALMGPGAIVEGDVTNTTTIVYIGEDVTEISQSAFFDLRQLEYVFFNPKSKCKSIMRNAFKSCTSLISIDLPEKLETIGRSSFIDCSSLETIRIPDKVTTIGISSFSDCGELTDVVIGKNVKMIPGSAFRNCSGIETLNIPDSVKKIGSLAFYSDDLGGLTKITGLKNIEYIGEMVFTNHTELYELSLPKSLKHIMSRCFDNTGIQVLTLVYNDALVIEHDAFNNMPNLSVVNLVGGNPTKWKTKLTGQDFRGCDMLLEKARQYNVSILDYVVDARRLEQEAQISAIAGPLTDKYFRYSLQGW